MNSKFLKYVYRLILILVLFIYREINSAFSPPTWTFNSYFQTQQALIKTNFNTSFNSNNPITKTIPFTKSYTVTPQFAFAIKNYRGADRLAQQYFAINMLGLTKTNFTLFTAIKGVTNIRILSLQYLAVDRSFPYHLNTFNNIDVNFSKGALVNLTGTKVGNRYYINKINYTVLAKTINSNFTTFGANLAKNYVGMYLCAIYTSGNLGSPKLYKYTIVTQINNIQEFTIRVDIYDGIQIDLLKFSMVIMDVAHVQSGGKFTIQFKYIIFNGSINNYINIPREFAPATYIGLLDFTADKADCGLQFNWEPDLANDRIIINASILVKGYSSASCGLKEYRITVFYVKTWSCLEPYIYFNLTNDLCMDQCAKYFYGNVTSKQCQPCMFACFQCENGPSAGCSSCSITDNRELVNNQCVCMPGFYYPDPLNSSAICVSCQLNLTNCYSCGIESSNFICYSCEPGYAFLNGQCQICQIENCMVSNFLDLTCSHCTLCMPGFALDQNQTCTNCSDYMQNCTQCSDLDFCTKCELPLFANTSSGSCQLCNLQGCTKCSSLYSCSVCDNSNGYYLSFSTNLCQQCNLTQCDICKSLTTCLQCSSLNNYFINTVSLQCEPCQQIGCLLCENLTACHYCNISQYYSLNQTSKQCYFCDQELSMFFNNDTLQCQHCNLTECVQCENLQECLICNQQAQYFMNQSEKLCYPCEIEGCLTCSNLTNCVYCDETNNYNLIDGGICAICSRDCICSGYVLPRIYNSLTDMMICGSKCGDGMVRSLQQCDDNNNKSYDGCSSKCQIEQHWSCSFSTQFSCCTLSQQSIYLQVIKVQKPDMSKNSIYIELQLKPFIPILTNQKLQKYVKIFVQGIPIVNQRKQFLGNQKIGLTYDYFQNIDNMKGILTVSIDFGQYTLQACAVSIGRSVQFIANAENNVPFIYFQQDQISKYEEIQKNVQSIQYLTYGLMIISLLVGKIVGLQLVGVLQLSYFVLAQQENVNLLLSPFMKLNAMNGLNLDLVKQNKQITPETISSLGYKALFLNNCNVMLALLYITVLTGGILYALSHLLKNVSEKLSKISKHIIKQGLLTLIMFNCFNIAFGVGIHFQYADKQNSEYMLSSVAALSAVILLFFTCGLIIFAQAKQFGEFKNKFKSNLPSQLYFIFTLGYRFTLGYYIAVQNQYTLSSLIIIGISFLFIGYNLVNLPFKDAYQNYRANVCHFNQLIIILVTNYYDSMKYNTSLQEKSTIFSAAEIQVASIYVTVILSAICLGVEIIKLIKKIKFSSSKIKNIKLNQNQSHIKIQQTQQDFEINQVKIQPNFENIQ